MQRAITTWAGVLLIFSLGVRSSAAQNNAIAGDWVGGFDNGKSWICLQIHFKEDQAQIGGALDRPLESVMGTRLGRVDFQSPRIQFELDKPERLSFVGDVRAGVMAGQITAERRTTPFHFTRIAKTLLGRRSRFAGKLRRDDERSADILRLRLRIFRDAAEVGYQTRFAYAEMTPLCIHRAPLGTHDRFIGFIIEHDAGNLPLLKGS